MIITTSPRAVAVMALLTALLPSALSVAAQSPVAGVIVTSNGGAAVLAIDSAVLEAGSALTIVTPQEPQQVGTATIVRAVAPTQDVKIRVAATSYYEIQITGASSPLPVVSIGVVGRFTNEPSGGAIVLSQNGLPGVMRARSCASNEGLHLTLWDGLPLKSSRLWHAYYYAGMDLAFTCQPEDTGTAAATSSIAGIARDASGGVLPGVTIDIVGAGRRQKVTTSVSGRYALNNLVPGLYQVTATLAGFEAAFCDVTVERGAEAVCNVTLRVGMSDPELARRGGFTTSPVEIGRFIKEALEDRFTAGAIADIGLLGRSGRVAIRQEMPRAKGLVPADAVPTRAGYTFVLTPLATLQADADRLGQPVYFLIVDSPTIAGDEATLAIGVDLILPSQAKAVKMCCCQALDRFRLINGRWMFDRRVSMACS